MQTGPFEERGHIVIKETHTRTYTHAPRPKKQKNKRHTPLMIFACYKKKKKKTFKFRLLKEVLKHAMSRIAAVSYNAFIA